MDGSSPLAGIAANAPLHDGTRESPARSDRRYLGRYELLARLGHGGMANVFLGRAFGDAGFEKRVAVKLIHSHLADDPALVAMFHDEARIAARIQHPNVVATLDLGGDQGRYFIALELVEGDTLAALLRATKAEPLSVCEALQVVCDALAGLAAAHDLRDARGVLRGVVHRDISPQNLLVGADGYVKVADFGIAKATGKSQHTRPGELRGKLAYMAPEQARGEDVNARCDLFAIGAVLWELLSSERYIEADSEAQLIAKLSQGRLPDPSHLPQRKDVDAQLHAALCEILRRSLAPDRDDRYTDAHEMLAALRPLLQRSAGSSDPRERLKETIREHFGARLDYIQRIFHGAERNVTHASDAVSTGRAGVRNIERVDKRQGDQGAGDDSSPDDVHTTELKARTARVDLAASDANAAPPVLRTAKLERERVHKASAALEASNSTPGSQRRPPTDGWLALPGPSDEDWLEGPESVLPRVPGSGPIGPAAQDWDSETGANTSAFPPSYGTTDATVRDTSARGESHRGATGDSQRSSATQGEDRQSALASSSSRDSAEREGLRDAPVLSKGAAPAAEFAPSLTVTKPRRSVAVPALLLLGALVALLASVWIATTAKRSGDGEDQVLTTSVHWFFSSDPVGAEIWIDGQRIDEVTPTRVEVPRGERPLNVELRLAGFRPMRLSIPPLSDQAFAYQLEPRATGALPLAPASKTNAAPTSMAGDGALNLVDSGNGAGAQAQLTVATPGALDEGSGSVHADAVSSAGNVPSDGARKTGASKGHTAKSNGRKSEGNASDTSKVDSGGAKDKDGVGSDTKSPPADFKPMPDFGGGGSKTPPKPDLVQGDE